MHVLVCPAVGFFSVELDHGIGYLLYFSLEVYCLLS